MNENLIQNEEIEIEYDFSSLNKLQLIEILEETVQDTDVVKIKDKVAAIKFNFLKICKEERDREMEQFILDGGEKENYEHVDDPLEIRFKTAFNIFRENKNKYNEALEENVEEDIRQIVKSVMPDVNIVSNNKKKVKNNEINKKEGEFTREEIVEMLGSELEEFEERRDSVNLQEGIRKKYYTRPSKKQNKIKAEEEYVY